MLEEKSKYESNLHRHFIMRVLAPPFVALLVLGVIAFWQLDNILRQQALDDLRRSATTTAATLEREFTLRETVLKQTGSELFIIKSEYSNDRKKLDENRDACRAFIQQKRTFKDAPNSVCEPFRAGFADGTSLLAALEDEYVRIGQELIQNQDQRINDRLSAYKQFFPETLALLVIDETKQPVSSALSGVFKGSSELFMADAEAALTNPIKGRITAAEGFELAIFAFPIQGGSVLVAYDLQNEHFVRQTWLGAPIDMTRVLAVLVDSSGNPAYPDLKDNGQFGNNSAGLRTKPFVELTLDGVDHTVVGAPVGASEWLVAIASPTAAVLSSLRDAQLIAVVFIGLFMIGFLWVGTFFVRRTLNNIVSLVSGAMVFGSGRLDYKISLDHADGEFMRLADTMNAMAERIAIAEKAIDEKNREFISIATHELRAPLTAIIGNLSLFQEMHGESLDKNEKHLIDQTYFGTVRLRDLVNDMLNLARLESGGSELALAPVAISSVVQDVVSTMDVVANLAKISLEYKDANATEVQADEGRLRIIINNFVSNAIKYNHPGGKVVVSHVRKGNQLVTIIEDNGLGIPEDQKARMFEKFFRVSHADRKAVTGTGLGMYITKQYIEQMQGQLSFESIHGKGTRFYFSLPIAAKPRMRTRIKKLVKQKLSSKKQSKNK